MGQSMSNVEEDCSRLEKNVIDHFEGQQLLIFGAMGSGKTSLINSFNHVINQSVNRSVEYQEVGEIADSQRHVTLTFQTYGHERNMYHLLKTQQPTQFEKGPRFFNSVGLNAKMLDGDEKIKNMAKLLTLLISGKVEEFTEMLPLVDPEAHLDQLDHQLPVDKNRAWSVLCVQALNVDFSSEIFKVVDSVERASKKNQGGIRVFIILTKADEIPKEERQTRIQNYIDRVTEILVINRALRVHVIENYTEKDLNLDGSTNLVPRKDLAILRAFNIILQPAFTPPSASMRDDCST
jgi:hypothetical protein